MSLWQGVKGAQVELAAIHNPVQKLRRLGAITKLFASELVGTIAMAPFGARAFTLYKSLPQLDSYQSQDVKPVYVVKDVRYGEAPRSLVDLYLPSDAVAGMQAEQPATLGVPVVVFVHGGVWAAGERWHYAPMAASLARLGVMACVVSYSLFPEALVPQLVQEVSAAFEWAMDNAASYGGDRRQVSLVGHSAGAQLCMMALLQRAQGAHKLTQQHQQPDHNKQLPVMPKQFVAVTGVYDIAKHYTYEKDRGVHELSTMKRAMGGFEHFAANSPAVILGAALHQQQQPHTHKLQQQQQSSTSLHPELNPQGPGQLEEPAACTFYDSFQLSGESIAHRIGFDRSSSHHLACEAGLQLQSLSGMAGVMQFPLDAALFLPPTVLISSCTDITVPWYESAEMYWKLLDCGVPVKHLVYNKVGHGDFVVNWPIAFGASSRDEEWGAASAASSSRSSDQQQAAVQVTSAVSAGGSSPDAGDADDWGSSPAYSNGNSSSSASGPSGSCAASLRQQRQALLSELPPYCRDIAVVVMGQQQTRFTQQPRPGYATGSGLASAVDLEAAAAGHWRPASGVAATTTDDEGVDAQMVVQEAELN